MNAMMKFLTVNFQQFWTIWQAMLQLQEILRLNVMLEMLNAMQKTLNAMLPFLTIIFRQVLTLLKTMLQRLLQASFCRP